MNEQLPVNTAKPYDEADLVSRARAGQREAIGDLFVHHAGSVRRLLVSVIGPGAELDDLTQDVFIQVHRSLKRFRGDSGFTTWLHRLTVNVAISHLRKKKRIHVPIDPVKIEPELGTTDATPHESSVAKEMLKRLYAILETVSPKRRAAFVLFEIEGYDQTQLAKTLGISRAAVKSRVWFARKEIMKKASKDDYLRPLLEEMKQQ